MSLISKIIGKLAPLISGSLSQEELRSDVVHGDPFENTPELLPFLEPGESRKFTSRIKIIC